jgi:hypothetical protein
MHAAPSAAKFRWIPAVADLPRVWLLGVLLAMLIVPMLSATLRASPEPSPVVRHYDPLMTW